ncbi:hypothetical protein [Mesorhizobium silamurunense]|uniref:hypothetical protein n=1 Tax=Mesorhizobium silamurunense TaxID=499528 RepID=UPI00177FAC95|nr:hypothetical protein [Mesorhizobium silamurunense]
MSDRSIAAEEPNWFDDWLRSGRLPDRRQAFELHQGEKETFACFDPAVLEQKQKGLAVPWPGDGPAADGYVTPWERI